MSIDGDTEMATQFVPCKRKHAGTTVIEMDRAKRRRTVHRADFILGLTEETSPIERTHFSQRLIGLWSYKENDCATALFNDGSIETFAVIFGADGVHSLTREHILGRDHPATAPVNPDAWRAFNVQVPMKKKNQDYGSAQAAILSWHSCHENEVNISIARRTKIILKSDLGGLQS